MHRCSNSQGNMVGPCSCGLFHHHNTQTNSFSMFFSMPNNQKPYDHHHESHDIYPYTSSSSSSSVDCTLSLGTPSTRLSEDHDYEKRIRNHEHRSSDSCVPNFCWDLLQTKPTNSVPTISNRNNVSRSGGHNNGNNNAVNDPLLARRCANCDTTSTPLWRNGPRGPKSLCNACGIRFKKEERRASAAAATNNSNGNGTSSGSVVMEPSHHHMFSNNSWISNSQQTQKMPCLNEFRFIDDDNQEPENGISFLSWRLNVTDRPSLVHDFTR